MPRFAAIRSSRVVGVLDASIPPTTNIPPGMTFADIDHLPEVTIGWCYAYGIFSEGAMTQKQQFLQTMQTHLTELGQMVERSNALVSAFVDRGYDAAASDPITDADLAPYGVIVYNLGVAVNLLQDLKTLTAAGAYEAAISKWRQL